MQEKDFRSNSRSSLAVARTELATGELERGRNAALHLRMALEALTYERAVVFRPYLPPEQFEDWQPRRVMKALLEIDPHADQGGTLLVGLEDAPGVAAKNMSSIGTEHVLSMSTIKKHYDALGSYLHLPSLKQIRIGTSPVLSKLRSRCIDVADAIEKALSSSAFGMSAGIDQEFVCHRCGEKIIRRTPLVPYEYDVNCSSCNAAYQFRSEETGIVNVRARTMSVDCLNSDCGAKHILWSDETEIGHTWNCGKCGSTHQLVLRVKLEESE